MFSTRTRLWRRGKRPGTGPLTQVPHPCRGNIRGGLALALFTVATIWVAGGLS